MCNTAVEEEVMTAMSPEIAVLSLSAAVIAFSHALLASLEWLEGCAATWRWCSRGYERAGGVPGYLLRKFRDDDLLTTPVTPENAQHLSGVFFACHLFSVVVRRSRIIVFDDFRDDEGGVASLKG